MQIKGLFDIYFDAAKWMEQFKKYVYFPTNSWSFGCMGPSSTISVISISSWSIDLLMF